VYTDYTAMAFCWLTEQKNSEGFWEKLKRPQWVATYKIKTGIFLKARFLVLLPGNITQKSSDMTDQLFLIKKS
jgi:hypothetical protein